MISIPHRYGAEPNRQDKESKQWQLEAFQYLIGTVRNTIEDFMQLCKFKFQYLIGTVRNAFMKALGIEGKVNNYDHFNTS
jgi:hypothetical protein